MTTINGYPIIYRPNHPRCNRDGYIYQHTEIAENKIGRFLKPEEVVHHKDKNRKNNNFKNLIIFATKSDHTSFHRQNCDENLLEEIEPYIFITKRKKINSICPFCGQIKDKKAKMCVKCREIHGAYNRVVNPNLLTRDKLKQLIRKEPFTKIGKDNGVTDNAIRKWCDFYKLPRTKKEINSYTDEEWEKI